MTDVQITEIKNSPSCRFINLMDRNASDTFAREVGDGLAAPEKYIHSKYIYDAYGSELFDQMAQEKNYYLVHAEMAILTQFSAEIVSQLADNTVLIELGSGSAAKTRRLLDALLHKQGATLFCPIDISGDFLQENVRRLSADYPDLNILGIIADFDSGLAGLADHIRQPKLLLCSDIGYVDRVKAASLLREKIIPALTPDDRLLLGIDLKKEADLINLAYRCTDKGDSLRHRFATNVLHHINRQLGGTFVPENFQRHCFYNEDVGRVEIYLKSLRDQQVVIEDLGQTFSFKAGELVRLHYSYKYDQDDIQQLAKSAGLQLTQQWFDDERLYSLNLFSVLEAS